MTKTLGLLLLFAILFLLVGINYAQGDGDETFAVGGFSVVGPRGWTAERTADDAVSFRARSPRAGEAVISVSAAGAGDPALAARTWGRIRSAAGFRNGAPAEGAESFGGFRWRTLSYRDEIGGIPFRCQALQAVSRTTQWTIRFECPEARYEALAPAFGTLKDSFSALPDGRT